MEKCKKILIDFLLPYRMVWKNVGSMVRFEIGYRLLSMLVFFPSLVGLERMLLFVNAKTNVAAYNAKSLAYNPLTWLVLALMVVMVGVYAMIEQLAVSDAVHASYHGVRLTARQMFENGVTLTVKYLRPKNFQILIYVLLILPFVNALDVSSVTKFFHLPGFLLESVRQYWYYALIFAFGIGLAFYMLIRWFFCIHVMTAEDAPDFKTARRRSFFLTKGWYMLKLVVLDLIWLGLLFAIAALLILLFMVLLYLVLLWANSGGTSFRSIVFSDTGRTVILTFSEFFLSWFIVPVLMTTYQGEYYRRLVRTGGSIKPYVKRKSFLDVRKFVRPLIVTLCAISIFVSVPFRVKQFKWMLNAGQGLPMIMAHRGYSTEAPEDTIEAMKAAIAIGVEAVEFDVQMTKDGVVVLLHDDSLARTTGLNKKIWEVTYEEIKDLDASRAFRREYGKDYPVTHIPTLDETLKEVKGSRLYCNIEIKRNEHNAGIEEEVVRVIEENDYTDLCDVTSQDYETLEKIRSISPEVLTAYTTVIGMGDIENLEAVDILSVQESFATFREVQRLRAAGKKIFVWTVNDENTMEKLISLNVDAILTNRPDVGQEVLDGHQTTAGDILARLNEVLTNF